MDKNIRIAIIGGGIGGLTTALCLEYFGFNNYSIYEQAKEFKEVGAAISLWPNALKVYQKIGIYNQLTNKWGEISAGYIKTDTGKVLSKTIPEYDLPLVCIHRADLHSILLNNISKEKLYSNYRLKRFNAKQHITTLHFENDEKVDAELIIGADGINSTVRKFLINDGKPIFRGYNIWRGVAHLKDIPTGYSSETWGKGKRIGIVPIRDNMFGWWATINEKENQTDEPTGSAEKLSTLFSEWHQPIPQLFNNSLEIIKNKIGDRLPTKGWYKNNIVLVGDAAHPTTPNLGQGACMAIEGAFLLSKCLNCFNNNFTKAFNQYENLHFNRSSAVIKQSLQNGKIGQLENSIAIKTRNILIKSIPEKFVLKMLDKFFDYDVTSVKIDSNE